MRPEPASRAYTPAAQCAAPAVLVLGFGNVLLSDDGAGVRVLERLRGMYEPETQAAQFLDAGTLSFSLLPYIENAHSLLVIDAAELKAAAGSTALFEDAAMDGFLSSTRRRTVHELGIIDLMDMARLRGLLPRRRALLCIQPSHIHWSQLLSEPVALALPVAVRQAQALLRQWAVP